MKIRVILLYLFLQLDVFADVEVRVADFSRVENISSVFDMEHGINGVKKTILHLDDSRSLKVVQNAPITEICSIIYAFKGAELKISENGREISYEDFNKALKVYSKGAVAAGCTPSMVVEFDSKVTGVQGGKVLKSIYDCGVRQIVFLQMQYNDKQVPPDLSTKPSSPK